MSKQQWIGIALLTVIMCGVGLFTHLVDQRPVSDVAMPDTAVLNRPVYSRRVYERDTVQIILQNFDPNTADSITLVHLGLKPWQVRNLLRYRAKGGRYRKPEDLRRLYGMTDSAYNVLKPFITIDSLERIDSTRRDSVRYVAHIKKDTILELNSTDTAELQLIRGIGRYTATQIIHYGQRLGGYANPQQIREIERLDASLLDSIIPHLTANADSIHPLRINYYSVERMTRHPYLTYTQAAALYEYRRMHIRIKSLDELRSLPEFSAQDIERLLPYLSLD